MDEVPRRCKVIGLGKRKNVKRRQFAMVDGSTSAECTVVIEFLSLLLFLITNGVRCCFPCNAKQQLSHTCR